MKDEVKLIVEFNDENSPFYTMSSTGFDDYDNEYLFIPYVFKRISKNKYEPIQDDEMDDLFLRKYLIEEGKEEQTKRLIKKLLDTI